VSLFSRSALILRIVLVCATLLSSLFRLFPGSNISRFLSSLVSAIVSYICAQAFPFSIPDLKGLVYIPPQSCLFSPCKKISPLHFMSFVASFLPHRMSFWHKLSWWCPGGCRIRQRYPFGGQKVSYKHLKLSFWVFLIAPEICQSCAWVSLGLFSAAAFSFCICPKAR
jgi:hypothetical protein